MSSAIARTVTLVEGANTETMLRTLVRGGALALSAELDADVLAAADSWTLEIHSGRAKDEGALASVLGVVTDDTVTFSLTHEHTNRDLAGNDNHNFWVVIYSLDGVIPTVWFIGWLPIWESNLELLSAPDDTSMNTLIRLLPLVTGFTGGGTTNLDGVTTTNLTVPREYSMWHTTRGNVPVLLRAGTDAAVTDEVVRPLDYHATTNAKVWIIG